MERPKNKSGWWGAIRMTNKVLGVAADVAEAAAKAGGNALKNANDAQRLELARAEIEPIMFVGNVRWIKGQPRPVFKPSLGPVESDRFAAVCNKWTSKGVVLDKYIRDFAGSLHIEINN